MDPSRYRDPATLIAREVCPHCKRPLVVVQRIECDSYRFPVLWYCLEHGAAPPMRSAVVNRYPSPDGSAA